MSYINLREKSRFLKQVEKNAGRDIRTDEITACEERADAYIEGRLGKSWDSDNVPKIIEEIADMLASARAWVFLHSGQAPAKGEYADKLLTEAKSMLQDIVDGSLGLKLPDGTWDEDYPGGNNTEDTESAWEIIF